MNRFRTIALAGLAGFVLAACAASSPQPEQSDEASQPPSHASEAAQASGDGIEPSFGEGVVADLEAMIPSTVGDLTMQKSSFRGNDYALDPDSDAETIQFLNDVGVSLSDIAMAIGFGFNTDFSSSASVIVIRASGADSGRLVTAFKNNMTATGSESPVQWSSANVGGKQVETNGDESSATLLYVRGDTLFIVAASDPAAAEEILRALP